MKAELNYYQKQTNLYEPQWASVEDKNNILINNLLASRQTMNLRLMPKSKVAIIKDRHEIIAHAGLDHSYDSSYPEFFSYYVSPSYRGKGFGKELEKFICSYCVDQKIFNLYLRVASTGEESLDHYRKKTGCYKETHLPTYFTDLCKKCELYGNKCKSQKYLVLNTVKRWTQLES